jgi:hypothetical protein
MFASLAIAAGVPLTAHASESATAAAQASRMIFAALAAEARRNNRADRTLVTSANAAERCVARNRSHAGRCRAAEASLQRAGVRLAAARRGLAQVAAQTAHAASDSTPCPQPAPRLRAFGNRLVWAHAPGVRSYVLVRSAPGQVTRDWVLDSTSMTPPSRPGETAQYRVRTAVNGSEWSDTVSIAYSVGAKKQDKQTAPTLRLSGPAIVRSSIAGVSTYILSTTTGRAAARYSVLTARSITVAPVTGETTAVAVRSAIDGSAWSRILTIGSEARVEAPVDFGEPFVKGINANIVGWGNQFPQIAGEMSSLGTNWEREDLDWSEGEPEPGIYEWSSFENALTAARSAGITLLPLVGYAPSWASPDDAGAYAEFVKAAVSRFGPGTTGNLQWWELWNEPYYAYAWSGKTPEPEAYARDVVAAAQAARSVAPQTKLLIAAEYGGSPQTGGSTPWETSWIADMFIAEPNLARWFDAVAVHSYGATPSTPLAEPGGFDDAEGNLAFQRIDTIREKFLAQGVNAPFWITEVGFSTWESSEAAQAEYYAELITQVKARPWVKALFPFCLREFSGEPTNNESGFGLLSYGSWLPKPAFTTLQEGLATIN